LLVIGAVLSVQIGAAFATRLFDDVGPAGAVLYRLLFGAALLLAIWRPRIARHSPRALWLAAVFGLALAGMNLCFYGALDRIPLGIAVTLEFAGPLGVAVAASRRRMDLFWVALAAAGILLLAGPTGTPEESAGVLLALAAGGFWAAYILLSARVGRAFAGGEGLAIAMAVGAIGMAIPGVAEGGEALLELEPLMLGALVAVLSSAVPYSLELEALRRLRIGTFGVLMSLEPAVAASVGLILLGQALDVAELTGMAMVIAASAGALRAAAPPPTEP